MACACETCDESLSFGCAYCCGEALECEHLDPRTGRCVDPPDCAAPCDSEAGTAAEIDVVFPPLAELASSGPADWMKPPGGPIFWANVNGDNTAPADDGSGLVEVPISLFFPDASDIAAAFAERLELNGWLVTGSGDSRHLERDEVGAVSAEAESGPFTFSNATYGTDPGESPCAVPEVELPFDGYRPPDETYTTCTTGCDETWTAALAACESEAPGSFARCECDQSANVAFATCMEDCRVDAIPRWLTAVQANLLDARAACCRGEYITCQTPCEQAYLDAVEASESTYGAAERDEVIPFAAFANGCSTDPEIDNPFGPRTINAADRFLARVCLVAARDAEYAAARETRSLCRADCQQAERVRRGVCDAREERCYDGCQAAFRRAYDECAICGGHDSGCVATAMVAFTTCQKDCCIDLNPGVDNDHALAACEWTAWNDRASDTLACCFGLETAIEECMGGDFWESAQCVEQAYADHESCDGGSVAYAAAIAACRVAHLGDCPDCFTAPTLPTQDGFDCATGATYDFYCTGLPDPEIVECPAPCSVDTGGICGTEESPGCSCPDLGCPIEETVSCGGITCTRTYSGCELVESDCPPAFTNPPVPDCSIPFPA